MPLMQVHELCLLPGISVSSGSIGYMFLALSLAGLAGEELHVIGFLG